MCFPLRVNNADVKPADAAPARNVHENAATVWQSVRIVVKRFDGVRRRDDLRFAASFGHTGHAVSRQVAIVIDVAVGPPGHAAGVDQGVSKGEGDSAGHGNFSERARAARDEGEELVVRRKGGVHGAVGSGERRGAQLVKSTHPEARRPDRRARPDICDLATVV